MFKELKKCLLLHHGGKEIILHYKEHKTLDDQNRKKLVNIVVDHMLKHIPENVKLMPSHETKIPYAKTIISLFPKLRYKNTQEGYVCFLYTTQMQIKIFNFILGGVL